MLPLDTDRISKLLLLLGSDKPGEVQAAAGALCRILKNSGRDLHDLAASIKGQPLVVERVVEKPVYRDRDEQSPQQIACWCLEQDTASLREHELDFVRQMSVRLSVPTEKQLRWLLIIHDKLACRRS